MVEQSEPIENKTKNKLIEIKRTTAFLSKKFPGIMKASMKVLQKLMMNVL